MKVVIDIPDNEIPTKQDIISVDIHFMDGKIVECDYPFIELEQEPCENCISRQAAIKPFLVDATEEWTSADIVKYLKSLPPVTPAPKMGHWIDTNVYIPTAYSNIEYVKCSCCGEDSLEEGNFCPNCGIKMEAENAGSD